MKDVHESELTDSVVKRCSPKTLNAFGYRSRTRRTLNFNTTFHRTLKKGRPSPPSRHRPSEMDYFITGSDCKAEYPDPRLGVAD